MADLKRGAKAYELEFVPWSEVVRVGRANFKEDFDGDELWEDMFEPCNADDYITDRDNLITTTEQVDTLQAAFDVLTQKKAYGAVPQEVWKLEWPDAKNVRDLWKPKKRPYDATFARLDAADPQTRSRGTKLIASSAYRALILRAAPPPSRLFCCPS